MHTLHIGLVGDYDATVIAHQAIPLALDQAAADLGVAVRAEWVPTEEIDSLARIGHFDGLWCVPASPYRNTDGALLAIRHARETLLPFLGTCGGFQHAVLDYARQVLGWADAEHAELNPAAMRPVILPLSCALVEARGQVRFAPGSRLALAYGSEWAEEGYRCRYGLSSEFAAALVDGPLRVAAVDEQGEPRAIELEGHPFFVATLFQPERAALAGHLPPVVRAFVAAVATA
jgi:CTP synthase (UTP-ammonia lyase)